MRTTKQTSRHALAISLSIDRSHTELSVAKQGRGGDVVVVAGGWRAAAALLCSQGVLKRVTTSEHIEQRELASRCLNLLLLLLLLLPSTCDNHRMLIVDAVPTRRRICAYERERARE
mgnify:CR=1 FL=1